MFWKTYIVHVFVYLKKWLHKKLDRTELSNCKRATPEKSRQEVLDGSSDTNKTTSGFTMCGTFSGSVPASLQTFTTKYRELAAGRLNTQLLLGWHQQRLHMRGASLCCVQGSSSPPNLFDLPFWRQVTTTWRQKGKSNSSSASYSPNTLLFCWECLWRQVTPAALPHVKTENKFV